MFNLYDPREGKRLSLLSPDGTLSKEYKNYPYPTNQELLHAYRIMVLSRKADEWAVSLNRQGRMPTYPPNIGQEANSIGALMAIEEDDWFVPSFRELGGFLIRGIPLEQVYLYWYGNEEGSRFPIEKYHTLPISVPIGSQVVHAVGLSLAEKLSDSNRIAVSFFGEGASSQGEVHEALNLASVWKTGTIFYVQNNQWAISLPAEEQTASRTVAEKAFGYGFKGIQIDGNDIFAVYAAVKYAAEAARAGEGPSLIEGYTYRLGAHTTSDDPSKYRKQSLTEKWKKKDPLLRLERYLKKQGVLSESDNNQIKNETSAFVKEAFKKAENHSNPELIDIFKYTYSTMPLILEKQYKRLNNSKAAEL